MYGGNRINIGCIPTKNIGHDAQHTDFVPAIQRKNEVVNFYVIRIFIICGYAQYRRDRRPCGVYQ